MAEKPIKLTHEEANRRVRESMVPAQKVDIMARLKQMPTVMPKREI